LESLPSGATKNSAPTAATGAAGAVSDTTGSVWPGVGIDGDEPVSVVAGSDELVPGVAGGNEPDTDVAGAGAGIEDDGEVHPVAMTATNAMAMPG
jgi:hypothetical protein